MFKDKVIIITGGSSGVGRALAKRLYSRGARLALVARDEKKLGAVADELVSGGSSGPKPKTFSCDVSDPAGVEQTFQAIASAVSVPGRS